MRIDRHYNRTGQGSLVFDKASELLEGPTMQSSTLPASNSDTISDTAEFFEGDTLTECLRGRYNAFRDYMVRVAGKARFLRTPLSEKPFGRARAFGLQLCAEPSVPVTDALDGRTGVDVTRAINGDVNYFQVNPQEARRLAYGRFGAIDYGIEVKLTVTQEKVSLALLRQEQATSTLIRLVRKAYSTVYRIHSYFRVFLIPAQNTAIVSDRAVFAERPLHSLIKFIGIRNLSNYSDNNLGREAKLILYPVVQSLVDGVLPEGVIMPCPLRNIVGRIVSAFKRAEQGTRLFLGGLELDSDGQLHNFYYVMLFLLCHVLQDLTRKEKGAFPPHV